MIATYARNNASSKTPDPRLTVSKFDGSDDEEPDFQRDDMWTRSQKSLKKAQLCKIEEEPELDTKANYTVQTFNNSVVDSS